MKQIDYITVQDLYHYARHHRLLDARIRICDGMAVSYYPDPNSLCKGRYEVIIDVSALDPIDYDDLDSYSQRIDDHADELDQWAQDQYAHDRNPRKDLSNDEYTRQRYAISGYGYRRK